MFVSVNKFVVKEVQHAALKELAGQMSRQIARNLPILGPCTNPLLYLVRNLEEYQFYVALLSRSITLTVGRYAI